MVIQHDTLATERQRRLGKRRVRQLQPIELIGFRIRNDRILRVAVRGAVVVCRERPEEIALGKQRRTPRLAGLEAKPHAPGQRFRILRQWVLFHAFES